MNLVYLWIEKNRAMENFGILLNSDYEVKTEYGNELRFNINKLNYNNSLYRAGKILDSYLIVGKNGTGKTTVLNMLLNSIDYEEPGNITLYYYIFENNGVYYIYSNCDDTKGGKNFVYINNNPIAVNYTLDSKVNKIEFLKEKNDFKFSSLLINKAKSYKYAYGHFLEGTHLKKENSFSQLEFYETIIRNYDWFYNFRLKFIKFKLRFGYEYPVRRLNSKPVFKKGKEIILELNQAYQCEYSKIKNNFKLTAEDFEKGSKEKGEMIFHIKHVKRCVDYLCEQLDNEYINKYIKISAGCLYFNIGDVIESKNKNSELYDCVIHLLSNYLGLLEPSLGLSTGEQARIELMACICNGIDALNDVYDESMVCYLLLEELEQYLHPEWCRLIYNDIVKVLTEKNSRHKFYLYLTTHSPYILSDFTEDHVINLDCKNGKQKFQTFGSNIYEILKKGMFLTENIGEYSLNMIREINNILSKKNISIKERCEKIAKVLNFDTENISFDRKEELKKVENKLLYFINSIGEPLIKMQLEQQWLKLEKEWNTQIEKKDNELISLISNLSDEKKEELISKLKGEMDVKD